MCWTKARLALLVALCCGFSFAAGGLLPFLAGPAGGAEVYRIGGQSFQADAVRAEFRAALDLNGEMTPFRRQVMTTNTNFRAAFLQNRYYADVLVADAEARGLLETVEARAWLRLAFREAVKQLYVARRMTNVVVSDAEIETYYNRHATALAQFDFTQARELVRGRIEQQKKILLLGQYIQDAIPRVGATRTGNGFTGP